MGTHASLLMFAVNDSFVEEKGQYFGQKHSGIIICLQLLLNGPIDPKNCPFP